MAIVHGEGVKVELLTERGWQDITGMTNSVEIEAIEEPTDDVGWKAEDLEVEVVLDDIREYVKVASGKVITAKPRAEE